MKKIKGKFRPIHSGYDIFIGRKIEILATLYQTYTSRNTVLKNIVHLLNIHITKHGVDMYGIYVAKYMHYTSSISPARHMSHHSGRILVIILKSALFMPSCVCLDRIMHPFDRNLQGLKCFSSCLIYHCRWIKKCVDVSCSVAFVIPPFATIHTYMRCRSTST